jgi:hypothetical protein
VKVGGVGREAEAARWERLTSQEQLREALDDLVRRGIVELVRDPEGVERYCFPDRETGERLLRESLQGGQ